MAPRSCQWRLPAPLPAALVTISYISWKSSFILLTACLMKALISAGGALESEGRRGRLCWEFTGETLVKSSARKELLGLGSCLYTLFMTSGSSGSLRSLCFEEISKARLFAKSLGEEPLVPREDFPVLRLSGSMLSSSTICPFTGLRPELLLSGVLGLEEGPEDLVFGRVSCKKGSVCTSFVFVSHFKST